MTRHLTSLYPLLFYGFEAASASHGPKAAATDLFMTAKSGQPKLKHMDEREGRREGGTTVFLMYSVFKVGTDSECEHTCEHILNLS